MATKKFKHIAHKSDFAKLMCELSTIKNNFDCFSCKVVGDTLICKGEIQPTMHSCIYSIKISYKVWGKPKVWIIDPVIEYNSDIHMFKDGNNLCLYYHIEHPWKDTYHIYDKIIPWTAEWLVFYELYLITGKWLGIERKHSDPKINE